jgi:hypothetical protein
MFEMVIVAALSVAGTPVVKVVANSMEPQSLRLSVAASPVPTKASTPRQAQRDSVRNGALIGAIAGAAAGATLIAATCNDSSSDEGVCTPMMVGFAGLGGMLGCLVGVGVDAMFEQAPGANGAAGRRRGVRLRVTF